MKRIRQMKRIVATGMAFTLCTLLFTAISGAETASPWKVVLQTKIEHSATAVGFIDDTFGITAGYAGETHYTNDGGTSWPAAVNDSMCRFGIDVVDETVAWTVGNGGNVRRSTDSGKTWQAVADVKAAVKHASFIDDTTGWVASRREIWGTTDGGAAWTDVKGPEDAGELLAMSIRTAHDGYIVDHKGVFYTTSDGGQTWTAQSLPLEKQIFNPMAVDSAPMAAVRFLDSRHGILALSFRGSGIMILRTTDGGVTWSKESLPIKAMGGAFFSHDGTTLTVSSLRSQVTVFQFDEKLIAK